MKTLLKTLATAALIIFMIWGSGFASTTTPVFRKLERVEHKPEIKKIVVTGNTKVVIVQCKNEWVNYYEDEADKITIKQIGNTLTIGSTGTVPVAVTVYVKDPYRIDACQTAEVRTSGCFNLKNLQVILKDEARARVKANTESLYTVIMGKAHLELLGTTNNHILKSDGIACLNTERFAALKTEHLTPDGVAVNASVKNSTATGTTVVRNF